MKIRVMATDIKRGKRLDVAKCPIALSLRRQFPQESEIYVGQVICVGMRVATISARARLFIDRFDRSEPVKPFTFELVTS